MKPAEVKAIIDGIMPVVKEYIDTQVRDIQPEKGEPGPQGEQGPQGEKGESGESVDMDAVAKMLDEMVKAHFETLEIPKGEKGDPGEKGEPGEKGDPGESVSRDEVFQMVKSEVESIEVVVPEPKDGRDALEIEILPSIEDEKSYPRGTFATHNGGLWRAFQQTQGMKGWECIVAGHAKSYMEMVDHRTARVTHVDSRGVETFEEYKIPAMVYREVWQEKETYSAGDVVTSGGSMWHCQKDNPEGRPGTSDDWKQCVKKGRDAR